MPNALVKKQSDDIRPFMPELRRLVADLRFALSVAEDELEKDALEIAIESYRQEFYSLRRWALGASIFSFFLVVALSLAAYMAGLFALPRLAVNVAYLIFHVGIVPIAAYESWAKKQDDRLYGSLLPLLPEEGEESEGSDRMTE